MKSRPGTKAEIQRTLAEAGVHFPVSDRFYKRMVLSHNGTKGRTSEILLVVALLQTLHENGDDVTKAVPDVQRVLNTPSGIRRVDLYFVETKFAVEIKSGYVRANHEFRRQVAKDVWLLGHRGDLVKEVLWVFLAGATLIARRYLERHGIPALDLAPRA